MADQVPAWAAQAVPADPAVAWLERNYDKPFAFTAPGYAPIGMFHLKSDHPTLCVCEDPREAEFWTDTTTAAKWRAT